jgi:hypothetical protein
MFVVFMWGSRSNVLGQGVFSISLAIIFGLGALAATSAVTFWWALCGTVIGVSQRLRYAIPLWTTRRAVLRSTEFLELAIDANVAMLEQKEKET